MGRRASEGKREGGTTEKTGRGKGRIRNNERTDESKK